MPPPADPAGSAAAALQFFDAPSFRAWRERLPVTDTGLAHGALAAQARALAGANLPAGTRFELLEALRELAAPLQAAAAKKYLGRPVPLDDDDRASWNDVVDVWSAAAAGYDGLIDAMAGPAPELASRAALICQRALRATGLAMSEHNRVYRKVPAALWRQLHRLYRFAETAGLAAELVHDEAGRGVAATSCAGAYLHALLTQLAQPDALTVAQMDIVERWLESWAALVTLAAAPARQGAAPVIAVDPDSDRGAGLAAGSPPAAARYLELEALGRVLRQAAAALRRGETPAGLGLGEMPRDACEKLVTLLHVQWCAAGTGRADERSPGGIVVTISPNIAAIHYGLTGRAFRQPGGEITARERQDMDMLGYVSESTDRAMVSQRSATIETWVIVNKSASGFLGLCRDPSPATRIGHNQLLGLRNPSNRSLYLGTVQRLIVDESGGIWVGLRLITSNPQALAARNSAARGPEAARYDRALLVPEDAARKLPASLVLLPGWFAPGRELHLYREKSERVQLKLLMDRGPNFERVTFSPL
ncbi:MAG: hypothetical protein IT529_02175 [Burkholderiales bacterium]|nr:hypothetical protein [Burkholderiales bacterium]